MISNALRTDLEAWLGRKHENPLYRRAADGTLTHAMMTRYIANLTHMIRFTGPHLQAARDLARSQGNEALARYYAEKIGDEVEHHTWGEEDLESLTQLSAAAAHTSITSAMHEFAALVEDGLHEDPANYLCYIAFTEYVTSRLGAEFLDLVESRCGISRSSLSIIDKHVELDVEHAEEGFAVFDDLVTDPRKVAPLRRMLARIFETWDRHAAEVTTPVVVADESSPRISAA